MTISPVTGYPTTQPIFQQPQEILEEKTETKSESGNVPYVHSIDMRKLAEGPVYPLPEKHPTGNSRPAFAKRLQHMHEKITEEAIDKSIWEILYGPIPEDVDLEEYAPKIDSLITEQNVKDLEIMEFVNKLDQLLKEAGSPLSKSGKKGLYLQLSSPTNDMNVIETNQNALKSLVDSPDTLDRLSNLFARFREHEKYLLVCISTKEAPELIHRLKNFYPTNKPVANQIADRNKMVWVVNLFIYFRLYKKVARLATLLFTPIVLTASSYYLISQTPAPEALETSVRRTLGAITWLSIPDMFITTLLSGIYLYAMRFFLFSVGLAENMNAFGSETEQLMVDSDAEDSTKNLLYHWAECFKAIEQIYAVVKNNSTLEALPPVAKMNRFFNDKDLQDLFQILHSRTFEKGANSGILNKLFYNRGRLMVAYSYLEDHDVRAKFRDLWLGVIGMNVNVIAAQVFNLCKQQEIPICIPKIDLTATTPFYAFKDLINPIVGTKVGAGAVANTLSIGDRFDLPNMVLGAANGGGKTTVNNAMLLALISASRVGFAFANEVTISRIDAIFISRNGGTYSKTAENKSGYMTQLDAMGSAEDLAQQLCSQNKMGIFSIDEALVGTEHTGQAARLISAIDKLTNCPGIITIFNTHNFEAIDYVTTLEESETSSNRARIRNFTIPVLPDEPYPSAYLLEKGPLDKQLYQKKAAYLNNLPKKPQEEVQKPVKEKKPQKIQKKFPGGNSYLSVDLFCIAMTQRSVSIAIEIVSQKENLNILDRCIIATVSTTAAVVGSVTSRVTAVIRHLFFSAAPLPKQKAS